MTIETITSVLFDLVFIGSIVAIIWFVRRGLRGGDDYWRQFAEARGYRLTVQHGPRSQNRPEPVAELETIMPVMQYKSLAMLRPRLIEGMVNGRQFALMELNPTWQRWFFDALRPRGLAVAPSFIFGVRVEVRTMLLSVLVMPLAGSKFSYFYPTLPQGYVTAGQWQGHSVWAADKATATWALERLSRVQLPDAEETQQWSILTTGQAVWLLMPWRPQLESFVDAAGAIAAALDAV